MAVHDRLAIIVAFTTTSISTVVVALRFYSRYFLVGKLSSPDWVMLAALVGSWSSAVVNYYQVHFLDYTHVKNKESFKVVVTGSLLTFWIYRLNYIFNLCLVKTSILLFYNHVTSSHKSFHLITRGTLALVLLGSIGMFVAAIFACTPPSDAWNFDVFFASISGIHTADCYDPTMPWLINGGFNLVTDAIIWILPIPFFLNLQTMPVRRRLELVGIFSIGIMAVVASAVRLNVLLVWSSSWQKQGENSANLLIWSQVEQHAAIISGSTPFLRPLIRRAFTRVRSRELPSPSPAAKLIAPQHFTPENPLPPRTLIIPSPSPTIGSTHAPFRVPPSPLSPIAPMQVGSSFDSAV
ncbi:hypothetical protein BDV95DRAFT_492494 [Massariosphaeria phaeospora]|uniref:Rhodopsin domain-containing protein n=1 Tax=Massariosphaeria phaeospora TaxID=100035 RepID=A0A7C8M8P7_9PLEO|nr:hypothetical protein BDV95DRAFT_492494 [Massariosphaeria phaeospora]